MKYNSLIFSLSKRHVDAPLNVLTMLSTHTLKEDASFPMVDFFSPSRLVLMMSSCRPSYTSTITRIFVNATLNMLLLSSNKATCALWMILYFRVFFCFRRFFFLCCTFHPAFFLVWTWCADSAGSMPRISKRRKSILGISRLETILHHWSTLNAKAYSHHAISAPLYSSK